ncbi:MAG: chemotaxis protein CheD [Candidatus Solibacter sp.]
MSRPGGSDLPELDLQPGELHLARGPAMLRTILGSCVGATFWCRRLQAGALCHGVLPHCPAAAAYHVEEGARYVDFSIRHLVREFQSIGVRASELEVKLFGGADVLPAAGVRNRPTVGALNCAAACEVVAELGLSISASDLGGTRGCRIHFDTGTGVVLLHRLPSWRLPPAEKRAHFGRKVPV